MAKLSVSVMAHKNRAHLVPRLQERLGIGDDRIVWDRRNDRWDTGRRAWELADPDSTHHIVIQDDAIVCRDFVAGMEKALEFVPAKAIVSPYIGTRRPMVNKVERAVKDAAAQKAPWVIMRGLNWGVGILAPTWTIDEMLPWCDGQNYPNYDRRIGRYFLEVMHWPTWCTFPSMVDHLPVPSLCGHGGGRAAHRFVGEDFSALDLDFDGGPVIMSQPGQYRYPSKLRTLPPASIVEGAGNRSLRATRGRPAQQLRYIGSPRLRPETPNG